MPGPDGSQRPRGSRLALVAALGLLLGLLALPGPARAATITYTYQVRGWDNITSLDDFAARAAQTYADPAGWGLGGSIAFVRVPSGGDFTLWLSAPQHLPAFASGCSTSYSCRVGRNVIINEAPFRGGTASWNATGASLRDYQHMVVNHETGHWLGFGHSTCSGPGQLAAVMQQQSKSMQGCRPNAWPSAAERSTLARWRGVPILAPPPPPPPGPPLIPAGTIVSVPVAGTAEVPADAVAVGVNLTVTQPAGPGFLTVFPCGTTLPATSNLNFAPGQTIAGFTLAAPGASGAICVRSSQATHLVVDVSGYVPAGATYAAVVPSRLLDTRTDGGPVTSTRAVLLPAGSQAAALTVTATAAAAAGFITAYPCDQPRPQASTVNFTAGSSNANLSLTAASVDGLVCFYANVPTHLVVDLVGTFPAGSGFAAAGPQRLLDTRSGLGPMSSMELALPGGGLHALNLTVTQPAGAGWARMFPCGSEPETSNINFVASQTVANAFPAQASDSGRVCIRASAFTHIVVDDGGTLSPTEYTPVPPVRLLDSRRS